MYFIKKDGKIKIEEQKDGMVFASSCPAFIVCDGNEKAAAIVSEKDNVVVSEIDGIEFSDEYKVLSQNIIKVVRRISNHNKDRVRIKSIFELKSEFVSDHFVFPGFNYDMGDQKIEGTSHDATMQAAVSNTPTGLSVDGNPWVFAYDREGIPSCSLSENSQQVLAIFASDIDTESLRSAASMIKDSEGFMRHRIFHPVSEMPYTYGEKNSMEEPYEEYMSIVPGGAKKVEMFIFLGEPKYENYGTANLMEACDTIFPFQKAPWLTKDRVWELGITYFRFLLKDCHGHPMVSGHYADRLFKQMHSGKLKGKTLAIALEDPKNKALCDFSERYEIGWADQGAMIARLFMLDGYRNDKEEHIKLGMDILDAYVESQWDNGLMYPLYGNNFVEEKRRQLPDACNMGWAMTELVRSYRLLKEKGIDKPQYLGFSRKIAEFALKDFSEEYGFAKVWNKDGSPKKTDGTVGGFMIMGLMEVYRETREERYLSLAKRAMDFYYRRDLDKFLCTAGALDCACVDKETAYPFVVAANDLYEFTGDELWLERAQKAAYYFFSWMFWYDAIYPEEAEFTKYGYYTTGGTLISAEHSALDPWGALLIREMMRLYHWTGNESFVNWSKMTWCNALLGIAAEDGVSIHGNVRPLGSQNEGFFHCRWTKYRPTCEERGHYNDNLQTWMGAWRLYTLSELSEEDLKYLD